MQCGLEKNKVRHEQKKTTNKNNDTLFVCLFICLLFQSIHQRHFILFFYLTVGILLIPSRFTFILVFLIVADLVIYSLSSITVENIFLPYFFLVFSPLLHSIVC